MNFERIVQRIIGILTLNDGVYEEIERDHAATTEAALIVALAGLLSGIGLTGDRWYAFIIVPVAALIGWVIGSYFIYLVGTRLIPAPNTKADLGEVLRLTGYARITAALGVFAFIPVLGWVIGLLAGLLGIVIYIKAIMHSLEMDIPRAIGTAMGSWLIQLGVIAVILLIFGIGFAIV